MSNRAVEWGGTVIAIISGILVVGEFLGRSMGDHVKVATYLAIAMVALLAPKLATITIGKDGFTAKLDEKIEENGKQIQKTKGVAIELDAQINQKLSQVYEEISALRKDLNRKELPLQTNSGTGASMKPLPSIIHSNDPQKDRFGGKEKNRGLIISAKVESSDINDEWQKITLSVRPEAGKAKLEGFVDFFLHDSFRPNHYHVPIANGEAQLIVRAWGAFTVGAIAGDERIPLELDLATSKNIKAPNDWRRR